MVRWTAILEGSRVRWLLLLLLTGALCACSVEEPEPEPGPPVRAVAPPYRPPPASEQEIDRGELLVLARAHPPDEVIARVDRHPLSFELSERALAELEPELPPEVMDYLRKRAQVDWRSLRGEVDPERDPPR